MLVKPWQTKAYRHVNLCGEARYAATLFAAIAGRAEWGVSEPQGKSSRATWVSNGPEVQALAEIAPTVRDRTRLLRDFMLHWVVAGEVYLVARPRRDDDPDRMNPSPVWEMVAVTEVSHSGGVWSLRGPNGNYDPLPDALPVIRLWNPDPANRDEAWSPFRALESTLDEIEYFTKHIFAQVESRLMSAGVWFLPNNLTFPDPPPDAVEGGSGTIATMSDPERFMASLAASAMTALEADEIAFPTVVMADPSALDSVQQNKLIQFWSEIDDKAMLMRSDAVRRFSLGMDLPPEQILGSSGMAVTGSGGSAGSANHWSAWQTEEQTISAHVEPALDYFVDALTSAFLKTAVPDTKYIVAYDTSTLRLRPDRSREAIELWDRGLLKGEVALRENGFDPDNDTMEKGEYHRWLLHRISGGSAIPEQVQGALKLLGTEVPIEPLFDVAAGGGAGGTPVEPGDPRDADGDGLINEGGGRRRSPGIPGRNEPRSLDGHPYEGPPREDHDHNPAPFGAREAACEVLVLRALEKFGNRLLNDRKRGRDKDRTTPAHTAHVFSTLQTPAVPEVFDFALADTVLGDLPVLERRDVKTRLGAFCASLVNSNTPYDRDSLIEALHTGGEDR